MLSGSKSRSAAEVARHHLGHQPVEPPAAQRRRGRAASGRPPATRPGRARSDRSRPGRCRSAASDRCAAPCRRCYFSSASRMLVSELAIGFSARISVSTRSRRGEVGGGDLRDEVPAAVGRMDASDLRHAAQRGHHGPGVGGAHLDRHDGADPGAGGVARQPDGEAEDHARASTAGRGGSAPCRGRRRGAAPGWRPAGGRRGGAARAGGGRCRRGRALAICSIGLTIRASIAQIGRSASLR